MATGTRFQVNAGRPDLLPEFLRILCRNPMGPVLGVVTVARFFATATDRGKVERKESSGKIRAGRAGVIGRFSAAGLAQPTRCDRRRAGRPDRSRAGATRLPANDGTGGGAALPVGRGPGYPGCRARGADRGRAGAPGWSVPDRGATDVAFERRRGIRGLLDLLRPWFDPRSRRPDPPGGRRFAVFLVAARGRCRLGAVLRDPVGDPLVARPRRRSSRRSRPGLVVCGSSARRMRGRRRPGWRRARRRPGGCPGLLRLAVASLAIPMLGNPDGLGFADWDFVLDKFEAVRRTILIWGQFPWWNPWCRGGFPLAAEPQIGAVSIATPMILAMGTRDRPADRGDPVRRDRRRGGLSPGLALVPRAVGGRRGGTGLRPQRGGLGGPRRGLHHRHELLQPAVAGVPRVPDRRGLSQGIWLGFWMAFALLNGLQYVSLYAVVLAAAVWLRALRVQPAGIAADCCGTRWRPSGCSWGLPAGGWRRSTWCCATTGGRR